MSNGKQIERRNSSTYQPVSGCYSVASCLAVAVVVVVAGENTIDSSKIGRHSIIFMKF